MFSNLATTRKGTAGERFVADYLRGRGAIPYVPDLDGPHPFDFIVMHPDSKEPFIVEVKTYPRLFSRPETGIDLADFHGYPVTAQRLGWPIYLLFVDVFERAVYGAYIHTLKPTATGHGKAYFSLNQFKLCTRLTGKQAALLPPIEQPERYKRTLRHFQR